jgi:cytochrome c oxidase assembly protein subunit 11
MREDHKNTAVLLTCGVILMASLAYACVPIYRIFCQKTGYGGTVSLGKINSGIILNNRILKIKFNSDVSPHLPWEFEPLQTHMNLKVGENGLAFYRVRNNSNEPISGIATYNVTPHKAAVYFNKIQCFCFIEQTIEPGKWVEMPVQFFIDPELAKDPNLKEVTAITLSYTFFPIKTPKGATHKVNIHNIGDQHAS